VEDLVNRLFQDPNNPNLGGLDLTALNIQRARDWGIPSYNEYREACRKTVSRGENPNPGGTFGKVNDFDELTKDGFLTNDDVRVLKDAYADVNDIDLFIGAVLEEKAGDSILGPTFRCLIAEQFKRLKYGDRFFYENCRSRWRKTVGAFSWPELEEIKKSSMARILCDNSDVEEIQVNVFNKNTGSRGDNPIVPCRGDRRIPTPNLSVFEGGFSSKFF